MKKLFLILSITIVVFACSSQKNEKQEFEKTANSKTVKLDSLYTELYQLGKFNGTVLVAENGVIVYEKAFGKANEVENLSLNTETKFELASVSKQFTAMGIVQLKKRGLLNYDDYVSQYIPELSYYKGITIRDLLVHTGGLPDYMELAQVKWDTSKVATNDDMIKLFEKHKPDVLFAPNESYKYSNTGYMLLGTIIERVSGKNFETFLDESIFKPASMSNTFIHRRRYAPKKIENYAEGYVFSDSLNRLIVPDSLESESYVIYLDGIVGDGMVNSNLRDLLRWDRILYSDKLINKQDKAEIFSSYLTSDSTSTDYGFGWGLDNYKTYGKIVNHSGAWAGYLTHIERHIDNDKTVIILQNNLTDNSDIPLKNTRKIIYNIPIEKPIKLDSTLLKQYSGIYVSNSGNKSEIKFEDGQLYYPYPPKNPQIDLELIPISETKFILDGASPEVTYTFKRDNEGNVINCRVQQIEQDVDRTLVRKSD